MNMFRTKDQAHFHAILSHHIKSPDAPLLLEGATGLGKTRAILLALMASGKRATLSLPTHDLIQQLMHSQDMAAAKEAFPAISIAHFSPARSYLLEDGTFDEAAYEKNREDAIAADLMICTSVSMLLDQRLNGAYNGSTERDLVLFDEADQIPELAALASEITIPASILATHKATRGSVAAVAEKLLKSKSLPADIKAKAKVIHDVATEAPMWYKSVGYSDNGDLCLMHRLPGRLIKKISNRPSTIFISATLSINGGFNSFQATMGIEKISRRSSIIEPTHHGHLSFHFETDHAYGDEDWLASIWNAEQEAQGPTLIVTPSYSLARDLGDMIPDATVREQGESVASAIQRRSGKTLIATGAWAGLDTPVQWNTIIIPQVPFPRPEELFEVPPGLQSTGHGQQISSYVNSKATAIRRMRQVFGRGIRHPDAQCNIVICDPRISQLGNIIPSRFNEAWKEGSRKIETRSKVERNPSLRKAALQHYGCQCQACGHKPIFLTEIEVHHLFPLSQSGETTTSLNDVRVLCSTCHSRAHPNRTTVTPFEDLIQMAQR